MKRFSPYWFAFLLFAGCADTTPFQEHPTEQVLAVIQDRSGSYNDRLTEQGGTAYAHFVGAKELFDRESAGAENRIILSQISGGQSAVLLECSPRTFGQTFQSSAEFSAFLASHPSGGSSPVFTSCAETVERLCRMHEASPGMRSTVLIYSDMQDNHGGKDRLIEALKRYAQYRVAVGMYWVDNAALADEWSRTLSETGIRHFVVYDKERLDPPLPQL